MYFILICVTPWIAQHDLDFFDIENIFLILIVHFKYEKC